MRNPATEALIEAFLLEKGAEELRFSEGDVGGPYPSAADEVLVSFLFWGRLHQGRRAMTSYQTELAAGSAFDYWKSHFEQLEEMDARAGSPGCDADGYIVDLQAYVDGQTFKTSDEWPSTCGHLWVCPACASDEVLTLGGFGPPACERCGAASEPRKGMRSSLSACRLSALREKHGDADPCLKR